MRIVLALALMSAPVPAQDSPRFDAMVMEQCLAAGLAEGCIGLGARLCETAEGAMARGLCLGAETAWWQARAEAARAALAGREGDVQALAARRGVAAPSLTAVEAGFAAYLQAACAWAEGQWDGVHSGWEWAECRLHLTAGHARTLQRLVEAVE